MRIPFDIKYRPQIESGEYKLETKAGFPAKVMDLEYNNKICGKCIAIKVTESDGDHGLLYTHEGKRASIFPAEEGSDLFIITPEPELSEFEKGYMRIVHKMKPEDFNDEGLKIAKEESAKLLELAKEELQEKVIQDYWKQAADRCVQAREEGKAEALKDLPRWNESRGVYSDGWINYGFLYYKNHSIQLSSLEKLPGFKED